MNAMLKMKTYRNISTHFFGLNASILFDITLAISMNFIRFFLLCELELNTVNNMSVPKNIDALAQHYTYIEIYRYLYMFICKYVNTKCIFICLFVYSNV